MCLAPEKTHARVNHAYRLIEHCLTVPVNPEGFLAAVMHLIHKLLTVPQLLIRKKISEKKLYALYRSSQTIPEFAYFAHTIRFLFLKLTYKYLSLSLHDEALYMAINTK